MAMICEPMQLHRLLVVTSEFHMPRTKLIFEWVVRLWLPDATVEYRAADNRGIDPELLQGRCDKEKKGCDNVMAQARQYTTKAAVSTFLFVDHGAYNARVPVAAPVPTAADQRVLDSY